jgi:hypothetical protein
VISTAPRKTVVTGVVAPTGCTRVPS